MEQQLAQDRPAEPAQQEQEPASADPGEVYRELCAQMRATDEISLKLLAAVPLATGVGITLLVRASTQDLPNLACCVLSVFAAVITFAIYRWERKNIATCGHLREWAHVLERDHFKLPAPTAGATPATYPHGFVAAPKFLGRSWGKTQAEALLYWTVIISWILAAAYIATR